MTIINDAADKINNQQVGVELTTLMNKQQTLTEEESVTLAKLEPIKCTETTEKQDSPAPEH